MATDGLVRSGGGKLCGENSKHQKSLWMVPQARWMMYNSRLNFENNMDDAMGYPLVN